MLDLLAEMRERTWVTIEYGLQTITTARSTGSAGAITSMPSSTRPSARRRRGLEMGVHVILGLPGESREDMQATARLLARLGIASVKLHNLHAGAQYALGRPAGVGRSAAERAGRVRWLCGRFFGGVAAGVCCGFD